VGPAIEDAAEPGLEDAGWLAEGTGGRFQPKSDVRAAVIEGSSWSNEPTDGEDGCEVSSENSTEAERGLAILNMERADMNDCICVDDCQ
jgi:hypothetical protein